jgi:hypothetical protein
MWKLNSDERLSRWRAFRKSLNALPLEQAVASVADFWTSCPFTPYYLDPDKPDTWPDPWTLVEENYWCELAKAVGMLYTIKLTEHKPEVEIRVYYDPDSKLQYNLVWIAQGKYVLNMNDGEVLNKTHIAEQLELRYTYGEEELKLNSY